MISLEDFLRPSQKQLFKRLCKKFKGKTLISKGNFILVKGVAPVMLVAHLDTVHEQPVRDICTSADGNIIMSPQGIGGDDRCGVFALVKVYRLSKIKPWLLFCCDEEIGGLGAKKFCLAHSQRQLPKEIDDLKFIIELDRKGSNDAVYYRCDNPDFEAYISGKGFQSAQGSFSDISLIAPELGIAAVNLSCGYYAAHTSHEYINRSHLDNTIQKVGDIVSESSRDDLHIFDYKESLLPISTSNIRHYSNLSLIHEEQNTTPHDIPIDLIDIYETLLDFYSFREIEYFRAEYGDHILLQIYNEEVAPYFYH
ncbi:MAG: hypothetical protein IKO74_12455 [Selenomonadaceae bacterium]|nr:hypothetical protein [Selenomonadaceae bacterium]